MSSQSEPWVPTHHKIFWQEILMNQQETWVLISTNNVPHPSNIYDPDPMFLEQFLDKSQTPM